MQNIERKYFRDFDDIEKLNKILEKESHLFYAAYYRFLTLPQLLKIIENKRYEEIENKIYLYLFNTEIRAKKRILYEQLEIFKPYLNIFDSAIFSFYNCNFIASYFTMVPLIEGVLSKWNGANFTSQHKPEQFVKNKCNDIQNKSRNNINDSDHIWSWYKFHCDLLIDNIKEFFNNKNIEFNRHSICHLKMNNIKYFESQKNSLRLFAIFDLIAEVYQYENPVKDEIVSVKISNGCYTTKHKYEIENKKNLDNLSEKYFKLFYSDKIFRNNIYDNNYLEMIKIIVSSHCLKEIEYMRHSISTFRIKSEIFLKKLKIKQNNKLKIFFLKRFFKRIFLKNNKYKLKMIEKYNLNNNKQTINLIESYQKIILKNMYKNSYKYLISGN